MPNTPIYNIEDTWNNESAVFDAIKINVTDTASDPLSKLLDLKVGGISQFKVDKAGNVTASGTIAGLDQVDNVADLDKPVSTLQQAAIDAAGGGAFDADADTLITPSTPIVLDQATGDEAALTLDYTTNKATSGDDTGLLVNLTDTNSPGTSKLLDLQVGGVSKFKVTNSGNAEFSSGSTRLQLSESNSALAVGRADAGAYIQALLGNFGGHNGLQLNQYGRVGWTTGSNATGGVDLTLYRDSAATLQLGADHATVATGQTIKAHDVATGTGADLTLSGGTGSVTDGDVILTGNVQTNTGNTGSGSNFIGIEAGLNNPGTNNNGFGDYALRGASSSNSNTAVGGWALFGAASSNNNTAVGLYTLYNLIGDNNVAVGTNSLFQVDGSDNTAVGTSSGRYQSGGTTGLTAASNSVFLGVLTKGIQGATNQIVIGDAAESIGANSVVLGNDSIVTTALKGNVGVGTTTPDANAALDVSSTTKAFLPPRMTTTEKNAVASPTAGMVVYDSTLNKLAVYTGAAWEAITSA